MSDEINKSQDDLDLDYARRIRMKLIEKTFVDETQLPNNKEDTKILLDSLSALEKVSIAKKRIKVDDAKNTSMAALAIEIAKVIRDEVDPAKVKTGNGVIPEFPEEVLEGFEIRDFETSEYKEQDYEEFKRNNSI